MQIQKLLQKNIIVIFVLAVELAAAQIQIKGTVYDRSERFAMPGVSVMGASGIGTVTDSTGQYSIRLPSGDSIYFSYLGKSTAKFPVKEISSSSPFDMSLQVVVDSLPSVSVRPRFYRLDSLENRIEYQKAFDYSTEYLKNMKTGRGRGIGVGLDMDMFFDARTNRRMLAFQQRLEEDERDAYVDHHFTRGLVMKITGLQSPALDTFMRLYRPSYELVQSCTTDYEFYEYISSWGKTFSEMWKRDHPN